MKRALFAVLAAVACASPAAAQIDLSGEWAPRFWEDQPERVPGPELGQYEGFPISDAARIRGEAWSASQLTQPEWQCRPHPADYIWRGPSPLSITKQIDPISREVSEFDLEWLRSVRRPVYLDNRAPPSPNAVYTWAGFSTAQWKGDMLVIKTDHLKESFVRRNGLPRSDRGTMTEYLIRNGDILTAVTLVHDPVYLTETLIRSTDYELDLKQVVPPYPCHVVEEIARDKSIVPHVLPGTEKPIEEYAALHKIPVEGARGGAVTMYPGMKLPNPAKGSSGKSNKPGVPVDLTGQWITVVTEDWRWRMVTPAKGDYSSVPLNAEGVKLVNAWDPAKDQADGVQCRAYGAGGVMRIPGQVRISWADDKTLKVETEAGNQNRLFHFDAQPPGAAPSWQGMSRAFWQPSGRPVRGPTPPAADWGSLRVVTTNLQAGYLRKNGVPYSANARVTEYYNRIDDELGESWLVVTTVIEDPAYLNQRFFTSTHYKRVADGSPWAPTPCTAS